MQRKRKIRNFHCLKIYVLLSVVMYAPPAASSTWHTHIKEVILHTYTREQWQTFNANAPHTHHTNDARTRTYTHAHANTRKQTQTRANTRATHLARYARGVTRNTYIILRVCEFIMCSINFLICWFIFKKNTQETRNKKQGTRDKKRFFYFFIFKLIKSHALEANEE